VATLAAQAGDAPKIRLIAEWGTRYQNHDGHDADEQPQSEPAITEKYVARHFLHLNGQQDREQGNAEQNVFANPIELTFHTIQSIVIRHSNGSH
jgi:hypothetical protein